MYDGRARSPAFIAIQSSERRVPLFISSPGLNACATGLVIRAVRAAPRAPLGMSAGRPMPRLLVLALCLLGTACSYSEQQRVEEYAALIEASEAGHPAKVEALLARGTPVDAIRQGQPVVPGSGWAPYAQRPSPLFVAAANGHLAIVQSLLKRKPWVDWRCCDSLTPLGTAAANGHQRIVEVLLAAGADPDVSSAGGMTAVEAARAHGHAQIAQLLEEAAARKR
jgi:hypothetical protein